MSVLKPINMYRGYLPATTTVLYTVGGIAGSYAIVKEIMLCNTHTTPLSVSIFTADSADSGDTDNTLFQSIEIAPDHTVAIELTTVLEHDETLEASATTADEIVATVSGVEYLV